MAEFPLLDLELIRLTGPDTKLNTNSDTNPDTNPNTTNNPEKVYGWIRDLPNATTNNFLMAANPTNVKKFPKTKLLTNLPAVYDQGSLGSCTANALAAAFSYEQRQKHLQDFMPSRLFIYYNERKIENNIPYDTGASISDGIKTLSQDGVCPEDICPYDIAKFAVKPSKLAYMMALSHQVLISKRVPETVNGFKTMINMELPVVFGFTVYESFESEEVAKSGLMPLPKHTERMLGGHAVLCVGYDDTMKSKDGSTQGFLQIRNSWGPKWGQEGYFWMPYDYVDKMKLTSDFWVITKNEEPIVKLNRELCMSQSYMFKISTSVSKIFNKVYEFVFKN
jgi:C1A family cysteine protease